MGKIVFEETIVLMFYLLIGVFLNHKKKYTTSVNVFVGYLLTNIALPAAIINSFQVEKTEKVLSIMKQTFFFSVIMVILTVLLSWGLATLFKKKGQLKGFWINGLTYSNILFIGLPIIDKLFGELGLVALVVFNVVANLYLFTIGIMIFSENRDIRIKSIITTPAILASLIGFLLFYFEITLPTPVTSLNTVMATLTAPMSMIINGMLFAQADMKELISDKDNILFTVSSVILTPLFFYGLLQFFVKDPIILGVLTVVTGMPTGALNAILAEEYANNGVKVSQYIALTTIASMVTLPILMSFS